MDEYAEVGKRGSMIRMDEFVEAYNVAIKALENDISDITVFEMEVKKLIFKKGDEIKYIYSEEKFVVLYVDDVNDLMYVMNSEGHIDAIDIFDADKYGLTGARYRIELTPDISLVSDKKESIDILKMEIQKINYELDRIVKELHALNKKK